jgi:hypothetical protein
MKTLITSTCSAKFTGCLFALLVLAALPLNSSATIINIDRTVGAGGVQGYVETDGTLGTLATANIVDWNLMLDDGVGTFNLLGPSSGLNSDVRIGGNALSATTSELLMDFDASGVNFLIFQHPYVGSGQAHWCIGNGCFGSQKIERVLVVNGNTQSALHTGVQVIGTATSIPEPATLAMLGIGLVGMGIQRRKK